MMIYKFLKNNNGSLLLEVLVVIAVLAVIGALVSQLVLASLYSNKWSGENTVALSLADDEIVGIKSASYEKWNNLYSLLKSPADFYYAKNIGGVWTISSGKEPSIILDGKTYSRYFTLSNVCRDNISRAIVTTGSFPPCSGSNSDDPSTQKVTVHVDWADGAASKDLYLTRWRNQTCVQTSWNGINLATSTCPTTGYDSAPDIDTASTPGSLKLQAN